MTTSDKVSTHHEDGAVSVEKKKRGCLAHLKKWWWAWGLGIIVGLVVIFLIIWFVAVPKMVQSRMNDAELTIDSILISENTPSSYRMSVNSTIRTDGKIHADIDGFRGAMYLEDLEPHKPFASIDFPASTAAKVETVNVSQVIEIEDMEQFTIFNTWLLANETLRMTVEGDTKVHVSSLRRSFGATFKKTVELKGLNGFEGLKVTHSDVAPARSKNNYNATVDVPNASILTIEIGNATFTNFLDGEDVGIVYMDNLVLHRSSVNNVTIHADIGQAPILGAMTRQPYCGDGVVPFELRGKNVTKAGEELTYYADALRALSKELEIPLKDAFQRAGLDLTCISSDDEDS